MKLNGRPGDERDFIHKKIFGGIKGAVGSVVGAISSGSLPTPASIVRGGVGGFFAGRRAGPTGPIAPGIMPSGLTPQQLVVPGRVSGSRSPTPSTSVIPNLPIPLAIPDVLTDLGRRLGIGGGNGNGNGTDLVCTDPRTTDRGRGFCEFIGGPSGGTGEATMGRFGAALEPSFETINKRVCLDGMVLGKDFLCYNKGSISNKERLWPKGRAPLLTGGQVNAIRIATAAKGKVARAAKQLGLNKPTRRAAPRHQHAKAATGVVSI